MRVFSIKFRKGSAREQADKESPRARAGKRFSSKKRAKALARLVAKRYK